MKTRFIASEIAKSSKSILLLGPRQADLNLFYRKMVKIIREVDQDTPIVLDSGFYATPLGFSSSGTSSG